MVDTIWSETQRQLRGALPVTDYEFWIAPLRATGWEANELTLEVASQFARDWIGKEHLALIERAVGLAAGRDARVRLVVNRQLSSTLPERKTPQRMPAAVTDTATRAEGRYTFQNFVVGESNAVAYRAAQAVVEAPGERYNPLFVHGAFGLGKTHLSYALADAIARNGRRAGGVVCVTAEHFVNEMIAALRRDQMDRFRQRYRGIGTLIVDDVQFLGGKKRSQEEFAHTFNALHELRKQIVLASDRPPYELPDMEDTLRNRFASGLLVDVRPPDPALRRALVERKGAALGVVLQPPVVRYLAEEWCQNVRELEGALTRLGAFASLAGKPVTLAVARDALAPYLRRNRTTEHASVARILGEVCRHYHLTRAELISPRRTARVSIPRQVAMYLCRRHTEAPLQAIGAELGGRDHSTVVHALGAIERRLAADEDLRSTVAVLESRLGS
ncbi:MAG TPA: chromosomal replication initiator protein DnaA [Candidatus Eisenbacteria bacterium]|nr:chromosomal replication initiator protein DnaA [Candidatus Eisenbacteria bacterium]